MLLKIQNSKKDYDYWIELSNGTSKPLEAAKTIRRKKDIIKEC